MNKAKINELYEKAYVTYEVPYESSVVDPTIVSVHKQKVWDRYLFAELIVGECMNLAEAEQKRYASITHRNMNECAVALGNFSLLMKDHFEDEE